MKAVIKKGLNQALLRMLRILSEVELIRDMGVVRDDSVVVNNFIKVDGESIQINKIDVENKIIIPNAKESNSIDIAKFGKFIELLSPSIVWLNHVGVSYFCKNLATEIEYFKKKLDSSLNIYEEDSGMAEKKWIFIGDNTNWRDTLFEMILVESSNETQNVWLPDFQIDIDTNLSSEEIKRIANKSIRDNFIDWELDIPDYGVVLSSGILGDVDGTKISVGVGTKLRNPKFQRENLVKLNH